MQSLAADLERGESLTTALAARGKAFPPVFRVVVEAGARSGQLASAVEGLIGLARRLAELRRTLRLALAYPLFLLILGYGLLIAFALLVAPPLGDALSEWNRASGFVEPPLSAVVLERLPETVPYWGPILPVAFCALLALGSYRINRGGLLQPTYALRMFGWIPWFGRLLRLAADALATDVLALLLERGVPLPEAVTLAASSSGLPGAGEAGERLADELRRGLAPERSSVQAAGLPPRVAWLLRGAFSPQARLATLRRMADTYRRRADDLADVARLWLPIVAAATIGGLVAALYALAIFIPWMQMLWRLLPAP
jgi:type II secretory pathway component PulF